MSTDATWDFDSPDQIDTWLDLLEQFIRGNVGEDEDGRFRAIEARAWRELLKELQSALEDLSSGDATIDEVSGILTRVKEFDAPYLSEISDWDNYFNTILTDISDAETAYGTNNDPETTFADVVEDLGEGIANTAKGIVDEWSDKITDCVGNPNDCIKKIGEALLEAGGVPEECEDLGDGVTCGTAEDPIPCWKDCVRFDALGLPGINLPLPPGVIDVGTYRDFENAVKTVGKTIGDLIDGDTTVEEVLEELEVWARGKWEEVFGGVDDSTPEAVLDWLKGILGSVTAGIIWAEIEEEVTNVLTPVGPDTKTCPDGSVVDIDEDCPPDTTECGPRPGYSGFQTAQLQYIWDRDCGPTTCLNGDPKTDPDGTNCEENQWTNDGPTPENCASFNRVHIPADEATKTPSSCGDCNEGWEEIEDSNGETACQEEDDPFVNQGPTAADCAEENKEFIPSTDVANSDCGGCLPGYRLENDECVSESPPYEPDCNGPRPTGTWSPPEEYAAWNDKCLDTNCPQDGSLISDHIDNDCNKGLTTDDPTLTEGEECGEGRGAGFVENVGGQLQCTPYWDGNCSSPFPSGPSYTFNLQNAQSEWETACSATNCSDGSDRSEEGYCPEDEGQPCEKENETGTVEGGVCVIETIAQTCEEQGLETDPETQECLTLDVFCAKYQQDERCVTDDPCSIEPASGSFEYYNCLNEGWGNCPEGTEKEGQWVKDTENNCGSSEVQECANGATTESGCEECPEGQSFDENEICVTDSQECAKPDGTLTGATTESGCEECPQGQRFDFNGICVADSGFTCDDYNRTTNEDGSCGPCKEGYETDTSLPNEPCVKIFDGCSAGFELVNGECTAIVCPEGQSYCIDTDGCVDIGTCPSDPPEEGGGSSGGGGGSGGSGMFAIEPTTVTADAQLLSRPEFPITDYLAGLFTNSTGGSA